MRNEANLWLGGGVPPNLTSERLLEWMKSPACDDIKRYYLQWGIPNIFGAITRSPKTRGALWRGLTSLVDKRNSIAHGDANMGATQGDVREYKAAVRTFVTRADAHLSLRLHRLFNFGPILRLSFSKATNDRWISARPLSELGREARAVCSSP
jgi:hypothetical protein